MSGFQYRKGALYCEDVSLETIASEAGTPCYVYSKAELVNRTRRLQAALGDTDVSIYFAVKACSNIHILTVLGRLGLGADIVSGGELFRAMLGEIAAARIVFSGVGKTAREIDEALDAGIHAFNVESREELRLLERVATETGRPAQVAFRVNPNVDAKTHPYISTGLRKNKFGLSSGELREIYSILPRLRFIKPIGLSCHIGSQITTKAPFIKAWAELKRMAEQAPFEVTHLDLGGGLGIPYGKSSGLSLEDYGRLVASTFKDTKYKLGLEPGRSIVGPAGVLLSSVTARKARDSKTFLIVDAGMNDLLRPALYSATHTCLPVRANPRAKLARADVVGPVCETADCFEVNARLPALGAGELLAFANAGAYGMTMSSQYNSRPRAVEVLVDGSTYRVIRNRETYADLVQRELQ